MSLNKMCPRCHTKYPYGESCPGGCTKRRRKVDREVYDKYQRKNKDIYSSARWQALRKRCIARDRICLWSYYKHNKIAQGRVVHHIIEIEDDRRRTYDMSNLILVSDAAHREIHKLYNNHEKVSTAGELFRMIEDNAKG